MTQRTIDLGTQGGADGTGDTIRIAGVNINDNFTELYATSAVQSHIGMVQNEISSTLSNADIDLKPSGTGSILFPGLRFNDNNIEAVGTNDDVKITPNGSGYVMIDGLGFRGTTITAMDSSSVNINENLIVDGTLTTTGNMIIDSAVSGESNSQVGAFTLANGSITDSSGAISFGNENLTTSGTFSGGTGSSLGNLTLANGSITDSSGAISFGNENLSTTGTFSGGTGSTLGSMTVSGVSSFVGTVTIDNLTFNDNIIATSSNADLILSPGGTGVVNIPNLTVDSNINLTDNVIKLTRSNDDLVLSANGTASVSISKIKLDDGTVDNTVIGATTPAAGTFTTLTASTSAVIDGVTITDNTITSTQSNADVELDTNATGKVVVNGIKIPNTDGIVGQVFKTDGAGTLSFLAHSSLYDHSFIDDASATVLGNSSAAQLIDSFAVATYRSAKYTIQISDATADRYTLIEANVTHDGTNAYISVFGGVDNGTGDGSTVYDSLYFTADVSGGNVRLLGTVNNTNNQVIKLVRRVIKG